MHSMTSRSATFRKLHEGRAFVIPNPWDVGSARILAAHGFKALATSSSAMAFAMGMPEGGVSRRNTFEYCKRINEATALPVSADLERGFGDLPSKVAGTVAEAVGIGLAGCSIEDHTGRHDDPIYDLGHAVERIAAAVEVARRAPQDFILTARCESLLWGSKDIDAVIRRLQAFEAVGADVLFAPGLHDIGAIETVCRSLSRPVNVVMEMPMPFTMEELEAAGVKRVSTGSKLACLAYGGLAHAARQMAEERRFDFATAAASFETIAGYFGAAEDKAF